MSDNNYLQVKKILDNAFELKKDKNYLEAANILREGLENYPDNKYLKTSLAEVFIRLKRYKDAEELAGEVLETNPEDHRALTVQGTLAYKKRNYEKALDYYQQAYTEKEVKFIATRIISTYMKLEEYQEALNWCQEWLERKPEDKYLLKLKAGIYKKLDKQKEARELYQKYRDLEPEDKFAYKEELQLKIKDKAPDEAVRQLRQLLRIGNRDQNPHLHTLLAEELEKAEKYEKAVDSYKKSLELKPDDKYILNKLGHCLQKAGRKEEALKYLKQAFRQDPSDFYIRSSLESIFKEKENYEEGIEFFKNIIKENPSFTNLWGIIKRIQKAAE